MSNEPTVVVRNASKSYFLRKDGTEFTGKYNERSQHVRALRPLSFVAYSGECIGLIGANGSGKSTLLNLIAGKESPTTGEILTTSRPSHLGVSAALQNHLSARSNIYLGLLAMGLERKEATDLIADILEWTEIEEAADRPLSTYSSGMRARLKFGIATAVPREILLVDEALSTGDAAFAAKAQRRMRNMLDQSGTVFLVSHSSGTIEQFCSRALWLHQGEILGDGDVTYMTKMYRSWVRRRSNGEDEIARSIIVSRRNAYKQPDIQFVSHSNASKALPFPGLFTGENSV